MILNTVRNHYYRFVSVPASAVPDISDFLNGKKMVKTNYYGDIYLLQLLYTLIHENQSMLFWL